MCSSDLTKAFTILIEDKFSLSICIISAIFFCVLLDFLRILFPIVIIATPAKGIMTIAIKANFQLIMKEKSPKSSI